nr:hypothetical protein BaRGS_006700 [Batillaria attramentaria]
MHSLNEKLVERSCTVPDVGFLISLLFNLLLIVVCAAHAFKTRRLPANFNEAKFITFTIYTTILLWLSFFPTYFTSTSYKVKVLCLTIAMLFNVVSCQVFLFLPKLYAVYFVDEEDLNVRENRTDHHPVHQPLPERRTLGKVLHLTIDILFEVYFVDEEYSVLVEQGLNHSILQTLPERTGLKQTEVVARARWKGMTTRARWGHEVTIKGTLSIALSSRIGLG